MKEVILYMLITVSNGSYNAGAVTHIADFISKESCKAAAIQISSNTRMSDTKTKCIQATVLIKE